MSFLPPQTLFMKFELLYPRIWSQDTEWMENEKTSSHFLTSPVCFTFYQLGPWLDRCRQHFPHIVFSLPSSCSWEFRGAVCWKGPLKVMQLILLPSDNNGSVVKTTYFILKYSTIPVGCLFQGWTILFPKCFLLSSKGEGRTLWKTNSVLQSFPRSENDFLSSHNFGPAWNWSQKPGYVILRTSLYVIKVLKSGWKVKMHKQWVQRTSFKILRRDAHSVKRCSRTKRGSLFT